MTFDLNFSYRGVPDSYLHRVQRYAVLYPLTEVCRTPHGIAVHTRQLVNVWRMRLTNLSEAGWLPAAELQRLRNCRPAFAEPSPLAWCCRLAHCPFCYARRVGEVWQRLEQAFQVEPTLQLVDRIVRSRVAYARRGEPRQAESTAARLRLVIRRIADGRTRAVQGYQARAAYCQTTIEPGQRGWLVRARQLLLYHPEDAVPAAALAKAPHRAIQHTLAPTRRERARIIVRVCRYPTKLVHGDPALTALLLTTLHAQRARLVATYGAFRGATYG